MTFGQWVKQARDRLELSQEECASRAGVHQSVWSEYENAEKKAQPRRSTVLKIARALGVSDDEALQSAGYAATPSTTEVPAEWRAILDKAMRLPTDKRERLRRAVDNMVEAAF